ncbi:cupin domain-containing protein [Bradyrhizobium neotropicale]|uniref:cupin domain-containing protein n=1 Tax=Bradyrhizobium neotropicale TaxID=1497615 RepID=UPI001374736E
MWEEFFYVLSGEVLLYTEHYAPIRLSPGDCSYFDSTMGHALVSAGEEDALILWIATRVHGGPSSGQFLQPLKADFRGRK